MKKNIFKIILGLILLFLIIYVIINNRYENRPFKVVELSNTNLIYNNVHPSYYDTVLSVAMNKMKINGANVVLLNLTDVSRNQFDGTLKAHVSYHDSVFYIFIENMNRKDVIEALSHEVIHIDQYLTQDLVYDGNVIWKGKIYNLDEYGYESRPWEINAFDRQDDLIRKVEDELWE